MNSEHFKRVEFACKCGCGFDTVDAELIEVLEDLRKHFDAAVHIHSGCRCLAYNARVGGSKRSKHTEGRAADVTVSGITPEEVQDYLEKKYEWSYGIGRYSGFTHIDTRSGHLARWRG